MTFARLPFLQALVLLSTFDGVLRAECRNVIDGGIRLLVRWINRLQSVENGIQEKYVRVKPARCGGEHVRESSTFNYEMILSITLPL